MEPGERTKRKWGELAAVLTLAWLTIVGVQIVDLFAGGERALRFREPALVASRSIERPHEIEAAFWNLPSVHGLVAEKKGDGPLGLHALALWRVSEQLLAVAQDLDATADRVEGDDANDPDTSGESDDALQLRRHAAHLAARALIVGAAIDMPAARLGGGTQAIEAMVQAAITRSLESGDEGLNDPVGEARRADPVATNERVDARALLAADSELAESVDALLARWDDLSPTVELPSGIDGLPALLVLDRAGALPPADEWAGSRAIERVSPAVLLGLIAALPMLVGLYLLLFTRRLATPLSPLPGRVAPLAGWTGFTAGQVGFALVGALLVLLGGGGITGTTVLLSSLPLLAAALWAAGCRTRGDATRAAERLGLTGTLRRAPSTFAAGLSAVPLMAAGMYALLWLSPLQPSLWSNVYLDHVLRGGIDLWRLMAIEAGVSAPIFEEIAFRGVLFAALRSRLSFSRAALASSAVFAIAHPYDVTGVLAVMWLGLVLCWLYERTGSLVACMVAHSAFNLAQLSIMLFLL